MRQTIYDEVTGKVLRDEKFEPTKRKPHYHYYLTFYSALTKADKSISSTMLLILGQMDSKNRVLLDKNRLHTLSNNYDISDNALKMAASRMCNDGLMQRTAPALYFVNPYYFTKTNLHLIEQLRKEYSELLFNTKKKAKSTEKKKITRIDKQIADINKASKNPVDIANNILNNSKPFDN